MEGSVLTASQVVGFAEKLEDDSAAFYQTLAERFEAGRETFLGFARESKKNKTDLVRTYQETITDALEATFSFEGFQLPALDLAAADASAMEFAEAVRLALATERTAADLYRRVADKAQDLLAGIPRAFSRVARRRAGRMETLQAIVERAGSPGVE